MYFTLKSTLHLIGLSVEKKPHGRNFIVGFVRATPILFQTEISPEPDTQASFADAVNVAAFFLTNSCTLSGPCPVSVSTSSDIRS